MSNEDVSDQGFWLYPNGKSYWGMDVCDAKGICVTKDIHDLPIEQKVTKHAELWAAKEKAAAEAAAKAKK